MPRRWQYDADTRPVSTSPETVHVDAWMQPPQYPSAFHAKRSSTAVISQPGNQRNFAVVNHPDNETWHPEFPSWLGNWAIRATAFAIVLAASSGIAPIDPNLETQKEAPNVSEWMQPPQYPAAYESTYDRSGGLRDYYGTLYGSGMVSIDPNQLALKESVSIDKFGPIYPNWFQRFYPQFINQPGTQRDFASTGNPQNTNWHPEFPAIIPRLPARTPETQFDIDPTEFLPKETVSLDKFHPQYSDWLPRPYPEATLVSSSGSQRNFAIVNHPDNETWHPEYPSWLPRPYPEATYDASGIGSSCLPVVSADVVTIDKWFQQYAEPLPIPYPFDLISLTYNQRNFAIGDKFQPQSYYQDWLAQRYSEGLFAPGYSFVTNLEVVLLDKWFQPASQPVLLPARIPGFGQYVVDPTILTNLENVTVDKWFAPPSQPTRLPPRQVSIEFDIDPKDFTQPEASHVETWMQPPQYPAAFESAYDHSGGPRDYFAALYASSGVAAIDPKPSAETPNIAKFKPDFPDLIVRVPDRSIALFLQYVTDPKLLTLQETASVDRFGPDYPSWIDRRFPEAAYVASGTSFVLPTVTEFVGVDKWGQPTNQPVRLPARTAILDQSLSDPRELASKEFITVDKWFQPASEPVRVPPRAASGQILIDPAYLTKIETVSVDKFHPMYADWIARIPNFAMFVASGVYFQPIVMVPGNMISPSASSSPLEIAEANVSDWNGPMFLNPTPQEDDS